ncbi:MAG: hypothetical protein ACRD5J_20065 [Nitrososphaeraceae archaeon]
MNRIYSVLMAITMCVVYLVGTVSLSNLVLVKAQDSSANHSPIENLPVINQDTSTQQQASNDKVSFKIKGIDYSTKIAQILVTIDGKTYANNFDPISLLDPHDDGNGVIQFDMLIPRDAIKPGGTYTACIKVLEDTDSYGNNLACQTGSTDEIHSLSGQSQNQQVNLYL